MTAYRFKCENCGENYISELASLANFQCHTCGIHGIRRRDVGIVYLYGNASGNDIIPIEQDKNTYTSDRRKEKQTSHPRPSRSVGFGY